MTDYQDLFVAMLRDAPPLSATGAARRDGMLAMLQSAVVRRRRQCTAARWTGAALVVLAFGALMLRFVAPKHSASLPPVQVATGAAPVLHNAVLEIVRDRPAGLEQWIAPPTAVASAELIDDQELVRMLGSMDRPAGLIRTQGRVIVTADVVDEPR